MTTILWDIVIQPLVYLIEFVFSGFWGFTQSAGIAIIGVSVVVNLLCLPLYKMADDAQERERLKQASMEKWVSHIRRTFSGDERYMMLSAYYLEQGYRPVQALVSSLSLLLQIPFFMAAYSYLSNLALLRGSSFLFLADLGAPDALITVGGLTINVLPVLMTLLNCASTAVYTRGRPLRDKVQAYVLAGLFLVLLYDSPSGLVFYWTCNQLFSLGKNVVMSAARSWRAKAAKQGEAAAAETDAMPAPGAAGTSDAPAATGASAPASSVAEQVAPSDAARATGTDEPAPEPPAPKSRPRFFSVVHPTKKQLTAQFLLAAALLTCFLGVLIPSAVIGDSPTEFVDLQNIDVNPLVHVLHTTCVWGGVWFLWVGTYFFLAPQRLREVFASVLWALCGIFLVDYFFFGLGKGTISSELVYDNSLAYDIPEMIFNALLVIALFFVLSAVWRRCNKIVAPVLGMITVALAVVAAPNIFATTQAYGELRAEVQENKDAQVAEAAAEQASSALDERVAAVANRYGSQSVDADYGYRSTIGSAGGSLFRLSTTERNVVVIFLDRAISGYLPYILNERPDLKARLDGFTYYPNTISFGSATNFGAPALYGGYEYSPAAMNERDEQLISEKHNEALLVLPLLFSEAGYADTIVDPPYAGNYRWYPDLSLYDGVEGASAYYNDGGLLPAIEKRFGMSLETNVNRQFFCYSLFKVLPEYAQLAFYDGGHYLSTASAGAPTKAIMEQYSVLLQLPELSEAAPGQPAFIQLANTMTHEPDLLQLPDYLPAPHINNEGLEDPSRFVLDGKEVLMDTRERLAHYHANAGALLRLGEWFDWMRENGVYDNSRIIIVSDHGRYLYQFAGWTIDEYLDIEMVNPLFMVKDFDAHGFTTSDEFMTNADAAVMALEGVVDEPVNPFTGVAIDDSEKHAHDQLVTASQLWVATRNNGTTFDTSDAPWYAVHDNIFDLDNWQRLEWDGTHGLNAALNGFANQWQLNRNGADSGSGKRSDSAAGSER